MEEALRDAVDTAYRVFAGAPIGPIPNVCFCPVCFGGDKALARRLVTTPLRDIPTDLLAHHTNSAHGWDDEMRYFLPRYLDLLAQGETPAFLGDEYVLARLANTPWIQDWPVAEREAVQGFLDTYATTIPSWGEPWDAPPYMGGSILFGRTPLREALSLVANACGDLGRVLGRLDAARDPATDVHLAALVNDAGGGIATGHLTWHTITRSGEREIAAWLARPAMARRMEDAFFAARTPKEAATFSAAAILGPPDRA